MTYKAPSAKPAIFGLAFLGLLIYILIQAISNGSGGSNSAEPENTTVEYELAVINAGYRVESSDPSISQFSSLLDRIERKCINSRRQIADAAVAAQGLLKEKGIRMQLIDVMRNLNNAIPEEAAGSRLNITEVAAAWVTLTDRAK